MRKTAVGMVILIILSLAFVILPPFLEDAYEVDMSRRLSCPSPGHPFGTDTLGRDVLARVVTGGRISLSVGFLVTLMTLVTALPAALACLHDGIVDSVLMRICDILKALPSTLLAILLSVAMGTGVVGIVIALTAVNIPQTARLIRARARAVDSSLFVMAKRAMGVGNWRILTGTILPHVLPSLLVQCAFVFSSSILAEAALSFIGAGLPAEVPSWGGILAEGRSVIFEGWWLVVFPSLFILLTVIALNLVADGIEER